VSFKKIAFVLFLMGCLQSRYLLQTVQAGGRPKPLKVFPPDPEGCWLYNVTQNTWTPLNCTAYSLAITSPLTSLTQTMDCSGDLGHCFLYFVANQGSAGVYGISANDLSPTSLSTTQYTNPFASFWVGVEPINQESLVQSGIVYGAGVSSSTPRMFDEFVGNFTWDGLNCDTQFCGILAYVNPGDTVIPYDYWTQYPNGTTYWFATVYDYNTGGDLVISIPASTVGEMYYGYVVFEGYGLTSMSMLPSSPISAQGIELYSKDGFGSSPSSGQFGCSYSESFFSCGSGSITMTISYSQPNVEWSW
jgi:hypothetical protein